MEYLNVKIFAHIIYYIMKYARKMFSDYNLILMSINFCQYMTIFMLKDYALLHNSNIFYIYMNC